MTNFVHKCKITTCDFKKSEQIELQLESKEIIVITGMRRVGNTTLLQMIYDKISSNNKVFLDLENILEQKVFEETDFNNIWANLRAYDVSNREKTYIFLDEIQELIPAQDL